MTTMESAITTTNNFVYFLFNTGLEIAEEYKNVYKQWSEVKFN